MASIAKREEILFFYDKSWSRNPDQASLAEAREEITSRSEEAPTERAAGGAGFREQLPAKIKEVRLPYDSDALYLIQRMRDEAHRFVISYHRLLRSKHSQRSLLDEIPGIGPTTKKRLLNHFGSLKNIRAATDEELIKVIGAARLKNLRNFL